MGRASSPYCVVDRRLSGSCCEAIICCCLHHASLLPLVLVQSPVALHRSCK